MAERGSLFCQLSRSPFFVTRHAPRCLNSPLGVSERASVPLLCCGENGRAREGRKEGAHVCFRGGGGGGHAGSVVATREGKERKRPPRRRRRTTVIYQALLQKLKGPKVGGRERGREGERERGREGRRKGAWSEGGHIARSTTVVV